jgi:hypothetical protein
MKTTSSWSSTTTGWFSFLHPRNRRVSEHTERGRV